MRAQLAKISAAAAAFADEMVGSGAYPTAVLLLADGEGEVWTHVAPGDTGVTVDSIFPVASLTKPVVAVAVMQLVEDGAIGLDDPVAKFIPEFELQGKGAITVRHLLTHTSGLAPSDKVLERLKAARAPIDAYFAVANEAALRF